MPHQNHEILNQLDRMEERLNDTSHRLRKLEEKGTFEAGRRSGIAFMLKAAWAVIGAGIAEAIHLVVDLFTIHRKDH